MANKVEEEQFNVSLIIILSKTCEFRKMAVQTKLHNWLLQSCHAMYYEMHSKIPCPHPYNEQEIINDYTDRALERRRDDSLLQQSRSV